MILVVLVVVVAVSVGIAVWFRRRVQIDLGPLPWDLADAARRQITLLTTQGAVAVTALVLLVTFSSKNAVQRDSFDTVVVMFLVAFLWFFGVAIEFAYLPLEGAAEGLLLPRVLYVAAGIQHYRTLFVSWLALIPLVETFDLAEPAVLLRWLLGVAVLTGWLIVASVCYRAGVLGFREAILMPGGGILTAVLLNLVLGGFVPAGGFRDALLLTLVIFGLNVVSFGLQAVAPMIYRWRGHQLIERFCRPFVVADLQAGNITLALLWVALLQPV